MMQLITSFILIWGIVNAVVSYQMKLIMPGVTPEHDDSYICSSFKIPNQEKESYIKSYESTTNSSVAHHILLYGCVVPYSTDSFYSCSSICGSGTERIIFAWAKDAQKFQYPQDAGMAVGGKTEINYLVLQVHYLKKLETKDNSGMIITLSYEPPTHLVNIGILFSYYGEIPANTGHVNLDISCRYEGKVPAYTLAFRTHAHALGRSISGFRVSNADGQINLIGRGNPQWPQTFYKANSNVLINPGDILMARCVFDSTGRDRTTNIGSTHNDEMCNFYIMLISKTSNGKLTFNSCGGNEYKNLWKNVPGYSEDYSPSHPSQKLMLTDSPLLVPLDYNKNWRVVDSMGEVSSVAILNRPFRNLKYTLLVLHRLDRYWGSKTFKDNVYAGDRTPIPTEIILNIDPVTGVTLSRAGADIFVMPHGLTATKDGKYIWVTDVALHQVMRFPVIKGNRHKLMDEKPDLVFGEKFVPGNDRDHFCKPTKVAVDSKGYIFVADGYCNSRIVCFYNGTYADEWHTKDLMIVVHSITIEEDESGDIKKNIVWVADRENQRIIGFKYDGTVEYIFSSKTFGMPIYAIEFNPSDRFIYGVSSNGMSAGDSFKVNYKSNSFSQKWHSDYVMNAPHDLCLAENGTVIFIAELHMKSVIKFSLSSIDVDNHPLTDLLSAEQQHMSTMYKTLIALGVFLALFCLLFFVLLTKLVNRFSKSGMKKKRYGPMYKDKEGFQPLTQNENIDEDGGNSDPETEEFSAPMSRITKKPKA